jgi:hypothetical protein
MDIDELSGVGLKYDFDIVAGKLSFILKLMVNFLY